MAKRRYRKHSPDRWEDRDPNVIWMEFGDGYVVPDGDRYAAVGGGLTVSRGADVLMQTHLIRLGTRVGRGHLLSAITPAWEALWQEVLTDPSVLDLFPSWDRKFEEFVAGGYLASEWNDVVLSPRSHDGGFDVAAQYRGVQIFDEAKAYRSSRTVGHQIIRAALGLLVQHQGVDQVRVTTTSGFAPLIESDFAHLVPDTLILRDRVGLLEWLASIGEQN